MDGHVTKHKVCVYVERAGKIENAGTNMGGCGCKGGWICDRYRLKCVIEWLTLHIHALTPFPLLAVAPPLDMA